MKINQQNVNVKNQINNKNYNGSFFVLYFLSFSFLSLSIFTPHREVMRNDMSNSNHHQAWTQKKEENKEEEKEEEEEEESLKQRIKTFAGSFSAHGIGKIFM